MDLEMKMNEDGSFVILENGEWKHIPEVIGHYIAETMPAEGFDMMEWKVVQTYTYILATAIENSEKAKDGLKALEAIWPETIQRYVEYMGWNKVEEQENAT